MADSQPPPDSTDSLLSDWWSVQGRDLGRMDDEALREFVKGVLRNEIFTSEQIETRVRYHCPKCDIPQWEGQCMKCGGELVETREPVIELSLVFLPLAMGALADWPRSEIAKIGCLWAYNRMAFPRSINGYPMFPEMYIMHRDDWTRALKAIVREQQRDIEV